jgi:hypothetical protein
MEKAVEVCPYSGDDHDAWNAHLLTGEIATTKKTKKKETK